METWSTGTPDSCFSTGFSPPSSLVNDSFSASEFSSDNGEWFCQDRKKRRSRCGTAATLRANARAVSSSESAREAQGKARRKTTSSRRRKSQPRRRDGNSFCLAYTGYGLMISRLQTKDGAALRAWTKRREEIFETVKLFRGKESIYPRRNKIAGQPSM